MPDGFDVIPVVKFSDASLVNPTSFGDHEKTIKKVLDRCLESAQIRYAF
jgi:hypothetical protein